MARKRAPGIARADRSAWAAWESLKALGDLSLEHLPDSEAVRVRERYANAKARFSAYLGALGSLEDALTRAQNSAVLRRNR